MDQYQSSNSTASKKYNIAIVGATGMTGAKTIEILEERKFPVGELIPIASNRFTGREIVFNDRSIKVRTMDDVNFTGVDLTFFCAGNAISDKYVSSVTHCGSAVIDKSSHFRLNPRVPLVIPEVNPLALKKGAPLGVVSTPNCIVVPLAIVIRALSSVAHVKRAVVSTYQSVSGAGRRAIDELYNQTKAIVGAGSFTPEIFPKQIAFNVIPAIGDINAQGVCDEEEKIISEIRKVLKENINVSVTCVRVPTFIGHGMSVTCEFTSAIEEEAVFEVFNNFDGIVTLDRRDGVGVFATPADVQGEDAVFVSRIRRDPVLKTVLMLWVTCDNLRKGAALNSVQIAEQMIQKDSELRIFKKPGEKRRIRGMYRAKNQNGSIHFKKPEQIPSQEKK